MDTDFPAAHSMDTHWFAVDARGQVALFYTDEPGFTLAGAAEVDSFETHKLVELARALGEEEPPGVEDDDVEDWDEFLEGLAGQGIYYYRYADTSGDPDPLLSPYALWIAPGQPLHLDQLPPDWRAQFAKCRLGLVQFGADEQVQPLDHSSDEPVAYVEDACAYLSGDEKVVRAIAGREEAYLEFREEYADQMKAQREGLRFEEPGPAKKKRKRRGDRPS
jgi:hypothetical protein